MQVALRAMGFPVKKADVAELMDRHGEDPSNKLDFESFRRIVTDKLQERTAQVSGGPVGGGTNSARGCRGWQLQETCRGKVAEQLGGSGYKPEIRGADTGAERLVLNRVLPDQWLRQCRG